MKADNKQFQPTKRDSGKLAGAPFALDVTIATPIVPSTSG